MVATVLREKDAYDAFRKDSASNCPKPTLHGQRKSVGTISGEQSTGSGKEFYRTFSL